MPIPNPLYSPAIQKVNNSPSIYNKKMVESEFRVFASNGVLNVIEAK
jgi:hypothetical protein